MGNDKPFRRLTLRQILSQSEKCARDLVELLRSDFMSKVADFRELIRPVRRRSHYPKIVSVQNALRKLLDTAKHTQELAEHLREHMETISDHANRERVSRM